MTSLSPFTVRFGWAALPGSVLALVFSLAAAGAAEVAPPPLPSAGSRPIRPASGATFTPSPPPERPEFWAAQFNSADKFDGLGIPGFRHETLVSRKLRFNGAIEVTVGYTLYLPPGYEGSAARYPTLYYLAANGGTENSAATMVQAVHARIVAGEMPPCIVVGLTGGRSFYGNQFAGKCQMHDFFFEELLPHVDKTYRTRPEARYRHLQGMSAGGGGAVMYALKHPELFGTVTSIAGAFYGARVNAWPEMHNSNEENYRPYDCLALLTPELAPKLSGLRLALWIGSADTSLRGNVEFRQLLQARRVAHTYNDVTTRPQLAGVTHDFRRYYEVYEKEILRFHAEGMKD